MRRARAVSSVNEFRNSRLLPSLDDDGAPRRKYCYYTKRRHPRCKERAHDPDRRRDLEELLPRLVLNYYSRDVTLVEEFIEKDYETLKQKSKLSSWALLLYRAESLAKLRILGIIILFKFVFR